MPDAASRHQQPVSVDLQDPDTALYARMRWNAPLSVGHGDLLLGRLDLRPGHVIADLGCGWGELLMTAVARAGEGATGIGVELDEPRQFLPQARKEAARRGVEVQFVKADASSWEGTTDRLLCVGAAHAFGGTAGALRALARRVRPGGRLLFGDGVWTITPSPDAVELFGDETPALPDLLELCRAAGWRVIHLSTASQLEWDDFESTFRAGRQEWLLANPADPRAAEIRSWIDDREREYANVYRGVLGFAYLVLAH